MCKNCGCGQRKPSKYAQFIKEHLDVHAHEHGHEHDPEHSDHYHDPKTGETVLYAQDTMHGHAHTHEHGHGHGHEPIHEHASE